MVALIGTMSTSVDGVSLAAAQTVAMTATAAIGVALIRLGDDRVGSLVLLGGVTMLIPWPGTWLTFGAIWTVIGLTLLVERSIRRGAGRLV